MPFMIQLTGDEDAISGLLNDLKELEVQGEVSINRKENRKSLLARDPRRKVEVVEVIVGFATSIAASVAYDFLKLKIQEWRGRTVTVDVIEDIGPPPELDTDKDD
ncbi:MAG: hypothetical protein H6741_22960 [Alphaproteobacteria bacterium]|nr:hypothetical protein [Alphaproteobacteria bacterium]